MIRHVPWMESPKADKISASIAANDAPAQVHRTATVTARWRRRRTGTRGWTRTGMPDELCR